METKPLAQYVIYVLIILSFKNLRPSECYLNNANTFWPEIHGLAAHLTHKFMEKDDSSLRSWVREMTPKSLRPAINKSWQTISALVRLRIR